MEGNSGPNAARAGCYAARLGGCSCPISRDHYISASILELLNTMGPNPGLLASGLAGAPPGQLKAVSPKALTVKVLCQGHNSQLSPLDVEALKLFGELDDIGERIGRLASSADSTSTAFDGESIERWLLKAALGVVVGNVDRSPLPVEVRLPDIDMWVQVLFGKVPMPGGCGLYLVQDDPRVQMEPGVAFGPREDDGTVTTGGPGTVFAFSLVLNGIHFFLSLAAPKPGSRRIGNVELSYRPGSITFRNGPVQRTVGFTWGDGQIHSSLNLDYRPPAVLCPS